MAISTRNGVILGMAIGTILFMSGLVAAYCFAVYGMSGPTEIHPRIVNDLGQPVALYPCLSSCSSATESMGHVVKVGGVMIVSAYPDASSPWIVVSSGKVVGCLPLVYPIHYDGPNQPMVPVSSMSAPFAEPCTPP